ncbi:DUF6708 domain-containing protein [Pseudomonas sp. PSKL.D1]|uniref:DUF6708 domain-containing protein n=1 Tax=Pseudomonas sp. PSKL.D1 TaxID=3029060 RepID=UPI002380FA67|nr:DUF6708 domain-containing protein [Pseudomonas sp. PSKL.D1]WDY55739.1 hypothetical protein PVV54_14065 [Pseudomonas sp. PSKL.D1]
MTPPCPAWKEDLNAPWEITQTPGFLGRKTPNNQTDAYLEIPRKTLAYRGLLLFISVISGFLLLPMPKSIYESFFIPDYSHIPTGTFALAVGVWGVAVALKMGTSPPRDEPIRFNRARQKIYAYNFHYRWWNPFEKWEVRPVSYDWSQVRAERWSRAGAMNGGAYFSWGVVLSIVEPGTNNVIDRFQLSTMDADPETWAYICTYMQEGPSALPPPGPPKDHNDVLWCEFALRLAPKVGWPAEMDLESRTAP